MLTGLRVDKSVEAFGGLLGRRTWEQETTSRRRGRQVQREGNIKKHEEEDKVRGRKQQKQARRRSRRKAGGREARKNKTTKLVVNFSGATLEAEMDIQGHQLPTSLSSESNFTQSPE